MNKISDYFLSISNRKTIIISSIIFVLFMIIVLPMVTSYTEEHIGSFDSPDLSLYYTSDDLFEMAESYGEKGRDTYILLRCTFDVLWPLVYLMFMATSIGFLLKKTSLVNRFKYIIMLPLFGVIFDFLENILSVYVMLEYPLRRTIPATIVPFMTMAKWTVLGLGFTSIFLLLILLLIDKVKVSK